MGAYGEQHILARWGKFEQRRITNYCSMSWTSSKSVLADGLKLPPQRPKDTQPALDSLEDPPARVAAHELKFVPPEKFASFLNAHKMHRARPCYGGLELW